MRVRRRKERGDDVVKSIPQKVWDELLDLLFKVIGETVKDKIARAALVGVITAFGQYAKDLAGEAPVDPPAPAITTPAVLPTRNDNAPQ